MRRDNKKLIVMLTYNDYTSEDAYSVFAECKNSIAKIWGLKEAGLPLEQMKILYDNMKTHGKTTVLEAVTYTEKKCMEAAKMAMECGCDILMGTIFFDSVNEFCKENNLKYVPFVGRVTGRPSILQGTVEETINQANMYIKKGVYGVNLLGYRYEGDAAALIKEFASRIDAPICLAGGINSYEKLDEVKQTDLWAFTIGGAFCENKFGTSHKEQINKVCKYINNVLL